MLSRPLERSSMAQTVKEYLANADECLRLVKIVPSEEQRKALLRMAETWQRLAREREAQLKKAGISDS